MQFQLLFFYSTGKIIEAKEQYPLKRVVVTDPLQAILKNAAKLRTAGAELIVLMYSADFDFIYTLLADTTIELALRKNQLSHLAPHQRKTLHPHHIYLKDEHQVLRLDMVWQKHHPDSLQLKPELINLMELESDPDIHQWVRNHSARLDQLLSERLKVA